MPDRFTRRCRNGAGATESREAGFRSQAVRIAAGGEQKLCGPGVADRVAGHEVGLQLIDDGGKQGVEVGDLVVQFEIPTGERFERDPVGNLQFAVARQIRAP